MKIGTVLVSSNENPEYYNFFPYIKKIWETVLNAKCILIYVGHEIPIELKAYKENIILYKPIPELHTAFIAQNIRLLYPALLNEKDGILIADVDSIPMSRDYYVKQVENITIDKFVNYSFDPKVFANKEHNMSYCLATKDIWSSVFKISDLHDIDDTLIKWNKINGKYNFDPRYRSKCIGFHFDQQILYKYLEDWNDKTRNLVLFKLEDRKRFTPNLYQKLHDAEIKNNIRELKYEDNIFLRPYTKKLKLNNIISNLLLSAFK